MKNTQEKSSLALLVFISFVILAGCKQTVNMSTADKAFQKREYSVSADLYKRTYRGSKDRMEKSEAAMGAAESFRFINDYAHASDWYSKVIQTNPKNLDALYQLALIQKSQEKYEEAKKSLEQYKSKGGDKAEADHELEGCKLALEWKQSKTRFVVVNEKDLNTRYSDFAAVVVKDREVFYTSDRNSRDSKDKYARTGDQYLAIYRSEIKRGRSSEVGSPIKVNKTAVPDGLGFEFNEGTCSFNKSSIYFTLCNAKSDEKGTCKIYEAQQSGKSFKEATILPFCSDTASTYGHPSISQDGKVLYFSSDMEGGFGGKDLYYVVYNKQKRSWSAPVNLGSAINTKKDEMYPFIHEDGTLYFSSDGHVGMGGLDIFYSKGSGSDWQKPENMKAPINSGADDFAITLNGEKETGMLSSNRSGGEGKDDIYSFYLSPLEFNLNILVKDSKSGKAVSNSKVSIRINKDSIAEVMTNEKGELQLPLIKTTDYSLIASKVDEYYLDSDQGSVSTKGKEQSEDFSIELLLTPINVEDEFTLQGIYYDVDKSDIREESKPILDSLMTLLKKYPKIHIEIGSHTDCRSSKEYNLTLSQKRAQAVVDYLISQGIKSDRLVAKGYGESRLVNDCACEDGKSTRNCTEAEHQLNRRTTFRIISK